MKPSIDSSFVTGLQPFTTFQGHSLSQYKNIEQHSNAIPIGLLLLVVYIIKAYANSTSTCAITQ